MADKKYQWVKGKIFLRKEAETPFEIKTANNGKPIVKFTVRYSKKNDDGSYDNTYYNCMAWEELGIAIAQSLHEKDSVLCKTTSKEREYNGKQYVDYTVYQIFKELRADENPYEQAVQQVTSAVQAVRNNEPFNFEDEQPRIPF